VVVLLVHLQVLGEVADALGEDCNLNLGAAGIVGGLAVLCDELCNALFGNAISISHCSTLSFSRIDSLPAGQANGGSLKAKLTEVLQFLQPVQYMGCEGASQGKTSKCEQTVFEMPKGPDLLVIRTEWRLSPRL
jgi:hypothetical protein